MVAKLAQQRGLARRLRRLAADAANPNQRLTASRICAGQFLGRERKHRLEQAVAWVANGKLRSVHAHRNPARAGSRVVADQRALPPLIQPAPGIERKRAGGNDQSALHGLLNFEWQRHSSESPVARFKVRWFAQRLAAFPQPVRDPSQQLISIHARQAK